MGRGGDLASRPRRGAGCRSPAARRLSFHNLHTDECVETCYWENGSYVPTALEQINTVLRDHRTGETRPMSPALIDLVFALTARLGTSAPVQVISGYRSPATNALLRAGDPGGVAEQSLHLTGEAVDLCFEDRPLHRVRDAALCAEARRGRLLPALGLRPRRRRPPPPW